MMRVVESAGFYFPDSVGGTEVYVNALAQQLNARGIECRIAAPREAATPSEYTHEGIEVFRYPFPENPVRSETQGRVPPRHFEVFKAWLFEQRADVYHQHSWTTGCGLWHLKAAKQLGLRTVLTVHVPANICMRGTMLYEGRVACDGLVLPERCAACWLQWKGLPPTIARSLAALPQNLAPLARIPGVGTALAARSLVATRQEELQETFAAADRIVAVCGWLHDALRLNGVPLEKLILNRQGIADEAYKGISEQVTRRRDVLRFGFLGRWDPLKGIHVLVEAFRRLPSDCPVELHIRAVASGVDSIKYRDAVQRAASGDARINFVPEAPGLGSKEFLSTIDALLVPSQWLETGPLVVLEAFSAGKPVIGSDLGGIKELVRHERDGLLVAHADVNAWTETMLRLSNEAGLIDRLAQGIGPVRAMSDVARETEALYREIVETKLDAA